MKQRDRLAGRWPGLEEVLEVREAAGPRRTEIEARILAGLSDARIAAVTSLTAAGVAWHEGAFFDVHAHIGARDWIL
ncbi:hypothetical protein [Zavarzinella formosa]|uniref:hypothetical protein n=1 Tax=Zavarzinella formosa TaxID=360055 RepID=UPI0002D5F87E|nr:hypothetical protein [Zavarzinella formosa]